MAYSITNKCEGCDDCKEVCPVMAINGEMKEQHEIDPNRCIECGACGRRCEKEGILDPDGTACKFVPREKWQKPEIDSKLCDGCGLCVEDCPSYCLALENGVSVLADKDACLGCGICVKRCPIQAIKMK